MIPAKLNVFFSFYPYGGNGSTSSEHPSIREWFARTMMAAKADTRIDRITSKDFSDTPITMTRNDAVCTALETGADVLVMMDSDQHPDYLLGEPGTLPFFESSFDFLYDHYAKGPVVIGAPYCGPPPNENVYIFRWATMESFHPGVDLRLEQYGREEAAMMAGIQEVAALPTGVIMYDLRAFEHIEPPYFYYEWTDKYERAKSSTEDVTNTRDISMAIQAQLGYASVFCNWDAWAGHYKPKRVGKPTVITLDQISEKYRHAVLNGRQSNEKKITVHTEPDIMRKLEAIAANGHAT